MNINPTYPNFPMANITPSTDSLRRENVQREVIVQPTEVQKPAAEKGAASDFDKAKTPGQNEQVNQANNQKQAEANNSTIGERDPREQSGQQQQNQEGESGNKRQSEAARVEQQQIDELKQRDAEVRAHEAAHANTAGVHAGSPSYTYQTGPDGKKYAVGGEVNVDLSKVSGDPRATIRKMQQVHAAALAPANPSSQDMQVAATAMRIMAEAQQQLVTQVINPDAKPKSSVTNINSGRLTQVEPETDEGVAIEKTSGTLKQEEDNVENVALATDEDRVEQAVFASEEDRVEEALFSPAERTDDTVRRALRIQNHYMNINYVPNRRYQISA